MQHREKANDSAVGLDVGTSRICLAKRAGEEFQFETQLNAFVTIPASKITENVLAKERVPHTVRGSQIVVHGNESDRFADLLNVETRRTMDKGLLNPAEPDSLDMMRKITESLLGPAKIAVKLLLVLLLLLLLLCSQQLRLVVFFQELRPLFVRGELFVRRQHRLRWRHAHTHLQFCLGLALHGSHGRRHVGIISTHRCANVPLRRDQIIRGIKSHPAQPRQRRFHPRVRRPGRRTVHGLVLMVEISAHVPARYLQLPYKCRHDVGEVLAHPAARFQCIIDGRIHFRGIRRVVEQLI